MKVEYKLIIKEKAVNCKKQLIRSLICRDFAVITHVIFCDNLSSSIKVPADPKNFPPEDKFDNLPENLTSLCISCRIFNEQLNKSYVCRYHKTSLHLRNSECSKHVKVFFAGLSAGRTPTAWSSESAYFF